MTLAKTPAGVGGSGDGAISSAVGAGVSSSSATRVLRVAPEAYGAGAEVPRRRSPGGTIRPCRRGARVVDWPEYGGVARVPVR
ncbi:hypothetical protein MTP06_00950 [Streptomyces sp. PLM4]|nr:hypothetical protein MTP06_00950 [Streptomyces sp. PLM4]